MMKPSITRPHGRELIDRGGASAHGLERMADIAHRHGIFHGDMAHIAGLAAGRAPII